MSKKREEVYNKYQGHCAYCGCDITMEQMQADHLNPKWRGGSDDLDNLMPACRQCNYYKSGNDLETFREQISGTLGYKNHFATRMAIKYGILTEHKWNGKFYFEKIDNDETI